MVARLVIENGSRYGNLLVVDELPGRRSSGGHIRRYFLCKCDCGKSIEVRLSHLSAGETISCGCRGNHIDAIIPTGTRFGRLIIRELSSVDKRSKRTYLCICDCGKTVVVLGNNLKSGNTTSCGCFYTEVASRRNYIHGKRRAPEYMCWLGMRSRCLNPMDPGYRGYGGRGITVCQEWAESIDAFLRDVGRRPSSRHSLDRIDVNGNYEPGNVRWATVEEQALNKRNSPKATHCGITKTVGQWAYELHLDINKIKGNLARGLTPWESVFLGFPRTRARREKLGWGKQPGDVAVAATVPPPPLTDTCAESALQTIDGS